MDLCELDEYFDNLGIEPTCEQLEKLFLVFKRDFMDVRFKVDGINVKIVSSQSRLIGYERYPETFVHLVTRKASTNKRVFDKHRANKIHWIKCILENRNEEEVTYFEYPGPSGSLRNYYWYQNGDFLVIMGKIHPDYTIITSFHIDDDRNKKYFEKKHQWYLRQKQT